MSEEVKKQPKQAKGQETEKTTKKTVRGTVVYIGPSIRNVVSEGTLYSNGLPEILIQEIARQPVIKSLIVPVSELAAAQRKLATPGSALSTIYKKVSTIKEEKDGRI